MIHASYQKNGILKHRNKLRHGRWIITGEERAREEYWQYKKQWRPVMSERNIRVQDKGKVLEKAQTLKEKNNLPPTEGNKEKPKPANKISSAFRLCDAWYRYYDRW
jgi:hypothetical protein